MSRSTSGGAELVAIPIERFIREFEDRLRLLLPRVLERAEARAEAEVDVFIRNGECVSVRSKRPFRFVVLTRSTN